MKAEKYIKNMRNGVLLLVFISSLIIFSMPVSAAYFEYQTENITYKYNTQILEAGINTDVTFLCPLHPVHDAINLGLWGNINRISYRNSTGYYEWVENYPFRGSGNLTHLQWGDTYTINMSSASVWTCPCQYIIYNEETSQAEDEGWIPLVWWGGECGFLGTAQGSDNLYLPDCLGMNPRAFITVYWCEIEDHTNDCTQWRVLITNDDPALSDLQNFTNGMRLWINNNETAASNFTLGVQCVEDIGRQVVIQTHDDYWNRGLEGVTVNLTHRDTGTTVTLVTDTNGRGVFNLTLEGFWSIRAAIDDYSQKYPYYDSDFYYWGEPTGLTISMHYLLADTGSLDIHVCEWNTTWEEEQAVMWGLFGYGTQIGYARCLPIDDVRIELVLAGNVSKTEYTGSEGRVSFYGLDVNSTYYIAANKTGYTQMQPAYNSSHYLNDTAYSYYRVIMVESERVEGEQAPYDVIGQQPMFNMPFAEVGWVSMLFSPFSIITMFLVGLGAYFEAQVRSNGTIFMLVISVGALAFSYMGLYPAWIAVCIIIICAALLSKMILGEKK